MILVLIQQGHNVKYISVSTKSERTKMDPDKHNSLKIVITKQRLKQERNRTEERYVKENGILMYFIDMKVGNIYKVSSMIIGDKK